ncbi:MAG: hypothetical protein GY943_08325 [Chloroflexi bacterium]|nr:hypothetical protein [Chloroflexota bacterium]
MATTSCTPTLTIGQTETMSYTASDGVLTDTTVVSMMVVDGVNGGANGGSFTAASGGTNGTLTLTLAYPFDEVAGTGLSEDSLKLFPLVGWLLE